MKTHLEYIYNGRTETIKIIDGLFFPPQGYVVLFMGQLYIVSEGSVLDLNTEINHVCVKKHELSKDYSPTTATI